MMDELLVARISELVRDLPLDLVLSLAELLVSAAPESPALVRLKVMKDVRQPAFREPVRQMLDTWQDAKAPIAASGLGYAMASAARAMDVSSEQHGVMEMIWTGPSTNLVSTRRTDQALLDVIQTAQQSLLIVSFAVYRVRSIHQAIKKALERGIKVSICVESEESGASPSRLSARRLLGNDLMSRAHVYVWPEHKRPRTDGGGVGVMHAKCALADASVLFVSSANLTEYAMELNIELGLLVRGGPMPLRVGQQFSGLIESGELMEL